MDVSVIKKYLMSYGDYVKAKPKIPFIFKIKKGDKWLYYFGAKHTYDFNDSQFETLKNTWDEFIDVSKEPRIALVEGGVRQVQKNEKAAILEDGEAGLLEFLAHNENITISSPEPTRKDETQDLESEFSNEEIEYYYFARMVDQWSRLEKKPDFGQYINEILIMDAKESGWKNFDFSLNNMKLIHKKIFKRKFDENDKEFFHAITNPTLSSTPINRYSQTKGVYRDAYIIKEVIKHINSGKNVFCVFGFTHAIMQFPAYRKLIKS